MKTTSKILVIALILISSINSIAQEEVKTITRPVHLSFITPMGTNGMESWKVTNIFSINMFAGYSGGLKGLEIGGFYNMLKGDMIGLQIAGFGNTNLGKSVGGQVSGFFNVNRRKVTGLQVAGFANVVTDSITAIQVSGFSNTVKGNVNGLQLSGFQNFAQGVAIGAQIGGFVNVNHGNLNGAQISGFANVNTKEVKGAQISGFVNYAKTVSGIQLGFINVADTVKKGASIGFLSFVRKGYHKFEISGNESLHGVVSFKTGTEHFYNILSVGTRIQDNSISWGYGYGIGTMFPVHKKVKVNVDLIAYHINDDVWYTDYMNILNKLNVCASMPLTENITAFGGITWNVHVSDIDDEEGNPVNSSIVTWSAYDRTHNNTNVKMYPGFTVGIRL